MALVCFSVLIEAGLFPLIAAAMAIAVVFFPFFLLEWWRPFRKDWRPTWSEISTDLAYTLLIQVGVPLGLYFLFRLPLESVGFPNGVLWSIWPVEWPLWQQLPLMMVIGELFQYAWHRLCHTSPWLWPIHAPHHAVQKLYSLNTVRFHFFDKLIESFITIQIFFLLGAGFDLVALYYVIFAMTGFVQHSNFKIKFGPWEYLFAMAETHRLHHHPDRQESACNYANNLVLWDLLFRTYRAPDPRTPLRVGFQGAGRPESFTESWRFPFSTWAEMGFVSHLQMALLNFLMPLRMILLSWRRFRFWIACQNMEKTQQRLLKKILSENQDTSFGQEHKFSSLTPKAFRSSIPQHDFEQLRPWIERLVAGEKSVLTKDEPFYFSKTSGTTGLPKYIPLNQVTQARHFWAQDSMALTIFRHRPAALQGQIFSTPGAAVEEHLGSFPAGSISGKLFELTPRFFRIKHALVPEVLRIQSYEIKYLALACLALLSEDVRLYISPNPGNLLRLLEVINSQKTMLKALIEAESFFSLQGQMNSSDQELLKDFTLKPWRRGRRRALRLLEGKGPLTLRKIWPRLECLTMWTLGAGQFLLPKLQDSAPGVAIIELGYISSEYRGTHTVSAKTNQQVPALEDCFFEFIEKTAYEQGLRDTLLLHEIEDGKDYYIIATTRSGLYRYFINDLVRVTGRWGRVPCLAFLRKGRGATNLFGEKLTEDQILALSEIEVLKRAGVVFMICLADAEKGLYRLYLETELPIEAEKVADAVHRRLCQMNEEYQGKTKSGRLAPVQVIPMKEGTGEKFKQHCLRKGQKEAQFKFLVLQYADQVDFSFEEHRSPP